MVTAGSVSRQRRRQVWPRDTDAPPSGVGVLLASGYAAEALAKHGGAGEFELVGKPYDMDVVLGRIAALAQRRGPVAPVATQDNRPPIAASLR